MCSVTICITLCNTALHVIHSETLLPCDYTDLLHVTLLHVLACPPGYLQDFCVATSSSREQARGPRVCVGGGGGNMGCGWVSGGVCETGCVG